MDKINFFPDDLNVQNQKIILRLDFNVPIKDKIIVDDTRIILCLPFIKKLIEKKAKIIIVSHLGRPNGIRDPNLSLVPIYKYLKKKLKTNTYFYMGNFDEDVKDKFSLLKEGEIILVENIRFFKEETDDDEKFSKKYINSLKKNKKKISNIIINEFLKLTSFNKKEIIFYNSHGWKYSYNLSGSPIKSYWNKKLKMGICADWFIGSKVESAWISANDLLKKIK